MDNKRTGPLAGLRILDVGTNIAGPFGATLLADFGAEVIMIEPPKGGDPFRNMAPVYEGKSLTWVVLARNKKSVTLNLKTEKGQEILRKLVKISDVLIENFRPGTMEKWGLGWDVLKAINPGLIMVRVSGFGQDGPYRELAAYDRVAGAIGGLTYVTGYPDSPPVRVGVNLIDEIGGLFNAFATMMALYHRNTSGDGRGQWVDVSLCESIMRLLEGIITEYDKLGTVRERVGNSNEIVAPAENFMTKDQKWMVFVVTSDNLFARLAVAIGMESLAADPQFKTNIERVKNREQLHEILRDWFRTKKVEEIKELFAAHGIPVGQVYNARDIVEDPHNQARKNIIEIDDPEIGRVKMQDVTPRFSETPGEVISSAPKLGEHNRGVYQELLGLPEQEIENLRRDGII